MVEQVQAPEHYAQRRRPRHRPHLVQAVYAGAVDLGLDQVQGPEGCAVARVLLVGRHHDDLADLGHGPGQHVQPDGVDAVIVGDKNAHQPTLAVKVHLQAAPVEVLT